MLALLLACAVATDSAVDTACAAPPTWYADVDGDGYGDPENPYPRCDAPRGFVAPGGDCDDNDPAVHPDRPFHPDLDGDGYGDANAVVLACKAGNGVLDDASDCDDTRGDVHPGAQERCDGGADEDCDGLVDGADPSVDVTAEPYWYPDEDGDGHGVPEGAIQFCGAPPGYAAIADDCDDEAASAYPGGTEACGNGTDDNCNGEFDGCGLGGPLTVDDVSLGLVGGYGDSFGYALAGLDDLDGDGLPELAVSAPAEEPGGVVRVFRSADDGWVSTGDAGSELADDSGTSSFGYRLESGDLDGDGLRDLVVADPEYTGSDGAHAGRVVVFLAPFLPREDAAFAAMRREGGGGDRYSAQLGLGDWNGDGRADLVAGGLSTGDGDIRVELDALTTGDGLATDLAAVTLTGSYTRRLAAGGDVDGDGLDDVVLATSTGATVVAGGATGTAAAADLALAELTVATAPAALALGDLDGDGHDDVLLGGNGTALLFAAPAGALAATAATTTWTDEESDSQFGAAIALLGDEDLDGDGDLLIGAYAAGGEDDVLDTGAALVFHAPFPAGAALSTTADARLVGREESSLLGYAVRGIGDRSGDGRADLLIGAPGSSEAYVLDGGGF